MKEQQLGGVVHEKCAECDRTVLNDGEKRCTTYIKPSSWFRREDMMCPLHGKYGAGKTYDETTQGKKRVGQQKGRKKRNRF